MVHRHEAVFLLRPFKKREFCDPHKRELIVVDQAELFAEFQTQRAESGADNGKFIRGK